MGSTYLTLTNKLLKRINEVEVPQADFPSVRGLHSAAKLAIQDSINRINAHKGHWPFNAYEHTMVLTPGVEEYPWPLHFSEADWESYYIQKDNTLNINTSKLIKIPRDQWYYYAREQDYNHDPNGVRMPQYVFESHGTGFGVTPSPERAYTLKFRYYINPVDLVNYDDTTTIPSKYDHVIVGGALVDMFQFKSDTENMDRAESKFREFLRDMTIQLFPKDDAIYDRRVQFGGGNRRSHMWTGK